MTVPPSSESAIWPSDWRSAPPRSADRREAMASSWPARPAVAAEVWAPSPVAVSSSTASERWPRVERVPVMKTQSGVASGVGVEKTSAQMASNAAPTER